jgi:hypothetical protein
MRDERGARQLTLDALDAADGAIAAKGQRSDAEVVLLEMRVQR